MGRNTNIGRVADYFRQGEAAPFRFAGEQFGFPRGQRVAACDAMVSEKHGRAERELVFAVTFRDFVNDLRRRAHLFNAERAGKKVELIRRVRLHLGQHDHGRRFN